MESANFEFIIVGGGIAGASAGYELARHGRVLLLERESHPGYHTTGRSAAMFSEVEGLPLIRRLARASRAFFESPPAGFCEHPLLRPRGALHVGTSGQATSLDMIFDEMAAFSPAARLLDGDEARRRVPVLGKDVVGAAWDPDARQVDVDGLLGGFLRGLRRGGAKLLCDAEVRGIEKRGGQWRIESRAGRFVAPILINAAGAWADEIARHAGVATIGVVANRRTAILFRPSTDYDVRKWPMVMDVDGQYYFRPEAGKILASPVDEVPVPPCDVQPEEIDVAIAVDRIETATTMHVGRVDHKWAGLRSFVADKLPVNGFDENIPGFYWLAGQGGAGIMTAPAMGRFCAATIAGDGMPGDMAGLGLNPEQLSPARLGR